MNDKELADAAKKILRIAPFDRFPIDVAFVRNWHYAGELMEKHGNIAFRKKSDHWLVMDLDRDLEVRNESLPRGIFELCVSVHDEQP